MKNEIASDLRFVGLHQDGEHLILATPDGVQHRLAITEMVRAAVRRDRPALEQLKNEAFGFLPPREIQAQIRAGRTAEEVAADADISLAQVRRYEGPVLAERAFIATTARNTKLAQEPGSPTLGEIVTDRLAHRGVDVHSLSWDAYRSEAHGWIVHAGFSADNEEKVAKWTFDNVKGNLHAIESEARWLSETSLHEEPGTRHLAAVQSAVYDFEQDQEQQAVDQPSATDELLDQLNNARGTRQQPSSAANAETVDDGQQYARLYALTTAGSAPAEHDVEVDPPSGDATDSDTPGPHPVAQGDSASQLAAPTEPTAEESVEDDLGSEVFGADRTPPRQNRKSKKQRNRMPSWDEIMFGAKPE